MSGFRAEARELLRSLVPRGRSFADPRIPLEEDECRWFLEGVNRGLIRFIECGPGCSRFRRWQVAGRHEFRLPPYTEPRHLFSNPSGEAPTFNREYLPHLAAHARAVYQFGYSASLARFSMYRVFSKDAMLKKKGQSYEIDSLFVTEDGGVVLQVEAKKDPREVRDLGAAITAYGKLSDLPTNVIKEIEYVMDVKPTFLWLVGPGMVDPERFIWKVEGTGRAARFVPVDRVPTL